MAVVVSKKKRRRQLIIGSMITAAAVTVMGWFGHRVYENNADSVDAAKRGLRDFFSSHSNVEHVTPGTPAAAPMPIYEQPAPAARPAAMQAPAPQPPLPPGVTRGSSGRVVVSKGAAVTPTDWSATADANAADAFARGDDMGAITVAANASQAGRIVNSQKRDDARTRRAVAEDTAVATGYEVVTVKHENARTREEAKSPFQTVIGTAQGARDTAIAVGDAARAINGATHSVDGGLRGVGEVFRHIGGARHKR